MQESLQDTQCAHAYRQQIFFNHKAWLCLQHSKGSMSSWDGIQHRVQALVCLGVIVVSTFKSRQRQLQFSVKTMTFTFLRGWTLNLHLRIAQGEKRILWNSRRLERLRCELLNRSVALSFSMPPCQRTTQPPVCVSSLREMPICLASNIFREVLHCFAA